MTPTWFLLLRATPDWLRLTRDERRRLSDEHLGAALQACPALRLRHFDAEAFSTVCSDLVMVESATALQQHALMERLRDSPLFNRPYFELLHVIPALEDGYRAYEAGRCD